MCDRDSVGALQRPVQQLIRLRRFAVRFEVVGLVEHDRVELISRHELGDLDFPGDVVRNAGEIFIGDDDLLTVFRCVRFGNYERVEG